LIGPSGRGAEKEANEEYWGLSQGVKMDRASRMEGKITNISISYLNEGSLINLSM
jgi:hypothetical protein